MRGKKYRQYVSRGPFEVEEKLKKKKIKLIDKQAVMKNTNKNLKHIKTNSEVLFDLNLKKKTHECYILSIIIVKKKCWSLTSTGIQYDNFKLRLWKNKKSINYYFYN